MVPWFPLVPELFGTPEPSAILGSATGSLTRPVALMALALALPWHSVAHPINTGVFCVALPWHCVALAFHGRLRGTNRAPRASM